MNRSIKFLTVEGIQKRKDPEKNYVYVLKVVWSDGTINIIYRKCSDFFRLQEDLKGEFPDAIGNEIPVLKGRKFYENCKFCFKDGSCKRMNFLNQFCHELINTQVRVSRSDVVLGFCKPKNEDLNPQTAKKDKKDKKEGGDDKKGEVISSPVVFEQHIAVADYKKQCKNDISLDAGDIVDVIEKNEYGWWLVDRDGELGWAPASYLEPIDEGTEDTITTQTFGPGKEEVYMSIKEHKAEAADELSFDIGVMLQVLQKTLDGWWLVRYHGREGWAPAMLLRKVDNNSDKKRKISAATGLRPDNELDIVSFSGEKEAGTKKEFMERNPPTRRSMVRRTIKKRRNGRTEQDGSLVENPIKEDLQKARSISTSASYHSSHDVREDSSKIRSDSMPPNYSPVQSPRSRRRKLSPQAPPRTISKNMSLSEIDTFYRAHNLSASSSGYDSSPGGSMTSLLAAGGLEDREDGRLRAYDTQSEFGKRNLRVNSGGMRRVHSSSELLMMYTMEQEELERQRTRASTLSRGMEPYMTNSLPRFHSRGRSSTPLNTPVARPIPAPRKISQTKSPLASQRSPEARSPSPREVAYKSASLERHQDLKDVTSVSDYENDESGTSSVVVPTMRQTAPKKESTGSAPSMDEQSSLKDDSEGSTYESYNPTDDAVFNPESQLQEENKENQDQNKVPDVQEADSPRYRATFCYDGEDEGELRFSEGEIIEVVQRSENGWWLLKAKGGVGWGPSTYLEALEV